MLFILCLDLPLTSILWAFYSTRTPGSGWNFGLLPGANGTAFTQGYLTRYTQIFENLFPEVFFPFNFAPGKSRIFGGMVRISEIQQLPEFLETFREISVPFRKSWLDGKRPVTTDQIYLYLCHKLPTRKLSQGAFKTILYPEKAERLTQISAERKSADQSLISFLILFYLILVNDTDVLKTAQYASCTLCAFPAPTPFSLAFSIAKYLKPFFFLFLRLSPFSLPPSVILPPPIYPDPPPPFHLPSSPFCLAELAEGCYKISVFWFLFHCYPLAAE